MQFKMRYWTILLFFNFVKVLCEPTIIGGRNAEPNTYGYEVSLRYPYERPFHFCGGSIISNRFVLTAAHCMHATNRIHLIKKMRSLIYAGTIYSHSYIDDNCDVYGIGWFKLHERFDISTLKNDVALIATNKTISFDYRIWPIQISHIRPPDGEYVTIAGWGLVKINPSAAPNELQVITSLQILNLEKCKQLNPKRRGIKNKYATDTNICVTGAKGHSTCSGDSGSPAVFNNRQFGIVSFGARRCGYGKRIVLTSVTDYIDWIQMETGLQLS